MRRRSLWTILAAVSALAGCDGAGATGPGYEEDAYPPGHGDILGDVPGASCMSQSVWAEPEFDWQMAGNLQLEVAVVQLDGSPRPDTVVSIFDDASDLPGNQHLIARGVTDSNGLWIGSALLPADQAAVTIVVNIMGARNWERVTVANGLVTAEFGRGD